MIVIVIGSISSYAYVTWKGRDESGGLTTTIGDLATVTFEKGVHLSSDNLAPVLNYEDGIYLTFNIDKKIETEVYMKSHLIINEIDPNLISNALKYVLLKSEDNINFENIATGDFSNIENNELKLLEDYKLETDITYYKLYIYIDGRQNNTNMANKTIDVSLNIGANKESQEFTTPIEEQTSPIEQTSITSYITSTSIIEE